MPIEKKEAVDYPEQYQERADAVARRINAVQLAISAAASVTTLTGTTALIESAREIDTFLFEG